MDIVCLDLEGVLTPEIWVHVSQCTGIVELQPTTRDFRDYDTLMSQRIGLLKHHAVTLKDIQSIILEMRPLPGAKDFLSELRKHFQVVIASDTFYEFAMPLMEKLDYPLLLCHHLQISFDGRITGYILRQTNAKWNTINRFHSLGYRVFAAGDSYNDIAMLNEADKGVLFCAPPSISSEYPNLSSVTTYHDLMKVFEQP